MPPPAETISKPEFNALLAAYPALPGQKTLQDLDTYRYEEAPLLFGKKNREMTLPDVQKLVEWKLRHGKYRPTLKSLISSNPPALTKQTISSALALYKTNPQAQGQAHAHTLNTAREPSGCIQRALDALIKLKGVGPATASLLLNVHDPERVVFFSDEAYYWLCCRGKRTVIRYTAREYAELTRQAGELARRLDVGMVDVEKVAYVVVNGGVGSDGVNVARKETVSKRKTDGPAEETGLRRSKRRRD
ncbi:hypothetical protein ED733_006894 [Metarhizium rileyi]|uniref:Uncharacterized protein n=1 Tax=Metarhizium rileyi (strain RCEF 4871) TaxID=1649241 RepID=A0A5C6GBQ4_METRR|nr:hypothetical protein ED733_006894 [Metarhizium rileyi]